MRAILAGIETEYGFTVEDRSVHDQADDAIAFVRAFPGPALAAWDYRQESPRHDLRGFDVDRLSVDPTDAQFDIGRVRPPAAEERSDRVLPNGARFYNDHGHPEYATPECWSLDELMLHDLAGELVLRQAAQAYAQEISREVKVYKNNTDFHGASYGTHESYLVPRSVRFDALYQAVTPLLIARQVLTGAGKVGSESKGPARFQMSQRADHLTEPFNLETLYRRPVFNTRDEPHADPQRWIRLHVITGDANMMPACTRRKVGLVQIALRLIEADRLPIWRIPDPVRSFQLVARDTDGEGRVELEGASWTTPRQIIESYLDAITPLLDQDPRLRPIVEESRALLALRHTDPDEFRRHVDWAAKKWLVDQYRQTEDLSWHDSALQSVDLAYHDIDPETSLYHALAETKEIAVPPILANPAIVPNRLACAPEGTRATARGLAASRFPQDVLTLSWSSITWKTPEGPLQTPLLPDARYDNGLADVVSARDFRDLLYQAKPFN